MKDDIKAQRALRRQTRAERKQQARAKQGLRGMDAGIISTPRTALATVQRALPTKNLWLHSGSLQPVTTPMYPTQNPPRPKVLYTDTAWYKLQYLIRNNTLEVGWWGTVTTNPDNSYTIEDIFVPKQKVSGATTDISPEGLQELGMKLMDKQGHADNLIYWGHLHPTFSCAPSGVDEMTVQEYLEDNFTNNGDVFIRGIYNKMGESKVDVYVRTGPAAGLVHQSVENTRVAAVIDDVAYRQFTAEVSLNVEAKVFKPIKQLTHQPPRHDVQGKFQHILPVGNGTYRTVEGVMKPLPAAAEELISQFDESELGDLMVEEADFNDPFYIQDGLGGYRGE